MRSRCRGTGAGGIVRRGGDPALLVLVRRWSALVAGCVLVVGVSAGLTAGRHGTELTPLAVALGAGSGTLLLGCGSALRRALNSSGPVTLDTDHDVLGDLSPLLGAATIARLERWIGPRRRPWRFAWTVSLMAGLALAAAHGVAEGGPPDLAQLPGAVLAGAILAGTETFSALVGFLVLGRWLGVRAARD